MVSSESSILVLLEEEVERSVLPTRFDLDRLYDKIQKLSRHREKFLDAKYKPTIQHEQRVGRNSGEFADYLGLSNLTKGVILIGSYLHDAGKYNFPKKILNEKYKVSKRERRKFIEKHPAWGADRLKGCNFSWVHPCSLKMVRSHHERYDGQGYPDNLMGEEIPVVARFLAIGDAFDAMVENRLYKGKKHTIESALDEIKANIGTQFDPDLAEKFICFMKKRAS